MSSTTRAERGAGMHRRATTDWRPADSPARTDGASGDAERPPSTITPPESPRVPHWVERLLRVPLTLKLAGANVLLLAAAVATTMAAHDHALGSFIIASIVAVAFFVAILVNVVLVTLALRPITMLEHTVDAIWRGDLTARVPQSLLADRDVERVGRMFNILLEALLSDRARVRRVAVELITGGDRERAAMSLELHDSTAQSLAALVMQLSVAASDVREWRVAQTIEVARSLATSTLEEVRVLAHTMHPRVLDDLGLVAAIRRLAREAAADAPRGTRVDVIASEQVDEAIHEPVALVLYRVAQEAVRTAIRQSAARCIEIQVTTNGEQARLEITDDGVGRDSLPAPAAPTRAELAMIRNRVAIMDGELHVTGRVGGGTSVVATVPLRARTESFGNRASHD